MSTTLDAILHKYVSAASEDGFRNALQAAAFVVQDKTGKTLYSRSLGVQHLTTPSSAAFDGDTVCWIASMSKLITSICALQIVEKGLLGLDDDVGKIIIPELSNLDILTGFDDEGKPLLRKQTKPITLRHLLSHSSGLSYDIFDPDIMKWSLFTNRPQTPSFAETLESYIFPLKFDPGEGWVYGVNIDWAGRLVEVLCNTTLEEYMQTHICAPLDMTSTTLILSAHPELAARRADIGNRDIEGRLVPQESERANIDRKVMGGGGGIFSTTNDYSKVLKSLISNDGKLLKSETVDLLFKPVLTDASREQMQGLCDDAWHDGICPEFPRGTPVDYALGGAVNLADVPGKRKAWSLMWSGLTNPHWWVDRQSGIAAVLMVQILDAGDQVAIRLYDELEKAVYKELVQ